MNPHDPTATDRFRGFFYSLAGSMLLATSWVTAKYALEGFNAETFAVVWMASAAGGALAIIIAAGQTKHLAVGGGSVASILLMGLAAGVGVIFAWMGLARLDPSFSAFLWRCQPVLSIFMGAVLLGEKLTVREVVAVGLMIFGGWVSTIGRWDIVGTGTLLTLFSCVCVALQQLIAKAKAREVRAEIMVFYRPAIAAVMVALWMMLLGAADFRVGLSYWIVATLGAVVGPCAGLVLLFRAYACWDLSRCSMVITTQPLFVLPMAYMFLGKFPVTKELIGGGIILIGALWLGYVQLKRKVTN